MPVPKLKTVVLLKVVYWPTISTSSVWPWMMDVGLTSVIAGVPTVTVKLLSLFDFDPGGQDDGARARRRRRKQS